MININNVSLVGRLVRDPDLRKTQSNQSVCSFTIAVNRDYKKKDGKYEADFIGCLAWNQSADFITQYARKGDEVGIKGRIQTRSYEDQNKKTVYITEVLAEHICIGSRKDGENVGRQMPAPSTSVEEEYEDDFSNTPSLDISSDDLPFY